MEVAVLRFTVCRNQTLAFSLCWFVSNLQALPRSGGRKVQDAQYWVMEFWNRLSVLDLIGGSVLGAALGLT